ncbi:MAG TPA: DUF1993 domain-containing protein [Hyphomonadaceae bacterium]|nr:DUF1993 domain-containing protein [Hyphomonadaceae bacterium]
MAITLYDATVTSFAQTLGAMKSFLAFSQKHGIDTVEIVDARLIGDMLPFRYQVQAAVGHSVDALAACKTGIFDPPHGTPNADYAALQGEVDAALARLGEFKPAEINALEGKDVAFRLGERSMPFTVENFLLSFSLPNFHFHCTTAYDILRSKGVPLGKRNYLGAVRMKT